ncbi:MAG TPA: PspC domain-containing protein [Allosphingosinicella sp.]
METTARQNLFTRDDTFFGICQGLGEDLGVSPDLFRVAMIPALFFFPVQTLAVYFGAGAVVLSSRLAFPVLGRKAKKAGRAPTTKTGAGSELREYVMEAAEDALDLAA